MTYESMNIASVIAEGFFAVYVKDWDNEAERQKAIAALDSILQSAYAHGMNKGQMDFAHRLSELIGNRKNIPSDELISIASKL